MEGINRLFQVLISPGEAFESAKKAPKIVLPLIILSLIMTGALGYYSFQMNAPVVIEKQLELSGKADKYTDAQKDQIVTMQSKVAKYSMPIGALVGTPIILLIIGLYFYIAAKLMGTETSYAQAAAVSVYSSATGILWALAAIIIMSVSDTSTTIVQNLVPSNLAYFFDMQTVGRKVFFLLQSIDIFSIWKFVLMIIGFSVITEAKPAKSAAVVLIPWVLYLAVTVLVFM